MQTIQTSAGMTQLQDSITDHSQPFTVKLHEDLFRGFKCEISSLVYLNALTRFPLSRGALLTELLKQG